MKKAIEIEETTEFEEKREIEKILAIIHSNYRDIHNHNELKKTVHISAAECSRLLRKYLNVPPMEYIRQHRITMACRLLEETNLSLSEIGKVCGMNPSYVSLRVRERTGLSPMSYRRYHLRKRQR